MAQANVNLYGNVDSQTATAADDEGEQEYEFVDPEGRIVEEDYINPVNIRDLSTCGEGQGSVPSRTGTSGVTGSKSHPTGTSIKACTKQCKALVISIALLFILVIALTGCTVGLYLRREDMGIANTNAQLETTLEGTVLGLQRNISTLENIITNQAQELQQLKNHTDAQILELQLQLAQISAQELQQLKNHTDAQILELQLQLAQISENTANDTRHMTGLQNQASLLAGIHGLHIESTNGVPNVTRTDYSSCGRCTETAPCNVGSLGTTSENRIEGCLAGVFQSDNYPGNYSNSFNHVWTIYKPRTNNLWMILDLKDFEFEARCCDYLAVSVPDDRIYYYTGVNSLRRIYSVSNIDEIRMRFSTDSSVTRKGFKAHFMFI